MDQTEARLRSGKTIREVCDTAELTEEAIALFGGGRGGLEFLKLLVEAEHYPDAVRFLAHALPKREAVWWAWTCARQAAGEEPPEEIQASLEATQRWIAEPTDELRRAAMERAQEADVGTAAGAVGLAVFLCGESIAPPEREAVPPAESLAARAISASIMLAAVSEEPERAGEKYHDFLHRGERVAERVQIWHPPEEPHE
ncbi:MAG: hypothetical protein PVI57_03320 [Gemmatimonadota bacterium]|jgi:hypothetical protein